MSYTKEWGDVYNKAAVAFTKEIHGFKAKKSTLAPYMQEQLEPIQRPLALLGALVVIDKIPLEAGNDRDRAALPAQLKLYGAALKKLDTAVKAYVKDCDKLIKLTVTQKDEASKMLEPKPLKELMPLSYRELKLLKTEAEALYARCENFMVMKANTFKNDAISKAKDAAMKKAGGDQAKEDAANEDAAMEKFILSFATSFKSSMAKGAHGIQKIKADPSLANYNAIMNSLGRDISQNLVNVGKLKNNAKFKKSSLAKKLVDPGRLSADITPFANGAKRSLPGGTSEDVIKQHLKEFTALYKTIATTYKDVIDGKVK